MDRQQDTAELTTTRAVVAAARGAAWIPGRTVINYSELYRGAVWRSAV